MKSIRTKESKTSFISVFLALLQDRQSFLDEVHNEIELSTKASALLVCSFACFSFYGAIVGAFSGLPQQIISSAIKLPALYLLTLMVCLPVLYICNALFGSTKTIAQHFTYVLSTASVISLLLCGFAPVVLFFIITIHPETDYSFFLLLNVTIFALTGIFGVSFLYQAMQPAPDEKDENVKLRANILRLWLCLYGFVGSQLGWALRPFFGAPSEPFQVFRPRSGNFLIGIWNNIANLL